MEYQVRGLAVFLSLRWGASSQGAGACLGLQDVRSQGNRPSGPCRMNLRSGA